MRTSVIVQRERVRRIRPVHASEDSSAGRTPSEGSARLWRPSFVAQAGESWSQTLIAIRPSATPICIRSLRPKTPEVVVTCPTVPSSSALGRSRRWTSSLYPIEIFHCGDGATCVNVSISRESPRPTSHRSFGCKLNKKHPIPLRPSNSSPLVAQHLPMCSFPGKAPPARVHTLALVRHRTTAT